MRILVASGTWYPEMNGLSRVATETARALAARGHEVTALVPRISGERPGADSEGDLTICRVLERGLLPLTVKDALEVRRHADRLPKDFDVLMAHGATMTVGLSRAAGSTPLVSVFHASYRRELRYSRPRLPWGRERLVAYLNEPISAIQERIAIRRAARILVLSEFSRSLLVADHVGFDRRVLLVSGGVDCETFSPADGTRAARARLGFDLARCLLVTVRRAEPRMGIQELIRATSLLQRRDVDLAIAGDGSLQPELRRLTRELDLDGRVHFLGRVTESQLPDLYRAADLFVLPTVAYEGFGMVTVEALASGTAVIGTPIGATPELLEPLDPRLVAAGSDAKSLSTAIRGALAFVDETFRAKCRAYAVSRFDWNIAIGGWESALSDARKPDAFRLEA